MEAASVNPLDFLIGSGTFYAMRPELPYAVCREGVGRVVEPASGQPAGRRKYFRIATAAGGAAAEYACVPRDVLQDVPPPLSAATAAALGVAGTAALLALTGTGGFSPGERVAVLGASGAVGLLAAQLATALGASRVVAVSRDAVEVPAAAASDRLVTLGTSTVTDAHEGSERWLAEVASSLTAAADGAIDLVIDPVWGAPALAALSALRPGGRLVNLGSSAGAAVALPSALVRGRSLRVTPTRPARTSWRRPTGQSQTQRPGGAVVARRDVSPGSRGGRLGARSPAAARQSRRAGRGGRRGIPVTRTQRYPAGRSARTGRERR